eukprot:TRINITY_DN3235_c0_g1_i5.p1 TRINITY_DN3235_c0_g1~~TRINITY_DN3235_c0_g1_i5.p1  ORF type:complete len:543 (-),score=123.95 TRINITY_DN3235_c0_g1_i5:66-1694(-)
MVEKFVRLIPVRKEWKELRRLGFRDLDQHLLEDQKKGEEVKKLPAPSGEMSETYTPPRITIYLKSNRATVCVEACNEALYKHGFRKFIGWGPMKESLVAACLIESGILDKAARDRKIRVWDPFCGSGAILSELYSILKDIPIRKSLESGFLFKKMPIFDQKEYENFLKEDDSVSKITDEIHIEMVGSDVDGGAISNSLANFETLLDAKGEKEEAKEEEVTGNHIRDKLKIYPQIRMEFPSQDLCLVNCDFEEVATKLMKDLDEYVIITNIPYGERSRKYIRVNQLASLYKRFGRMIKKLEKSLLGVFVIARKESPTFKGGFRHLTDVEWDVVFEFKNGPLEVCLYKWKKADDVFAIKDENKTDQEANESGLAIDDEEMRGSEDEEEGVTSSEEESGAEDGDSTVQSPNEKIAKKGDEGEIVFDPEVELKRQRKREARKAKAESKKRGDKVLTKKQKEEAERQKKYLNFQKKVLEREKEELEAKKERIVAKRVRTMKENMKLESAELLQDNLKEVVEEKLKKAVERKRQQAEKRDAPRKPPKW